MQEEDVVGEEHGVRAFVVGAVEEVVGWVEESIVVEGHEDTLAARLAEAPVSLGERRAGDNLLLADRDCTRLVVEHVEGAEAELLGQRGDTVAVAVAVGGAVGAVGAGAVGGAVGVLLANDFVGCHTRSWHTMHFARVAVVVAVGQSTARCTRPEREADRGLVLDVSLQKPNTQSNLDERVAEAVGRGVAAVVGVCRTVGGQMDFCSY